MGSSAWTPGRRPWKVDCADGFTASDVAVVVASLFGHVDGVERTMGDPDVGSASALAASRSRCGGLTRRHLAAEFSGAGRGFFRAKAQRLCANGGDACGCRNPLGGVVVVILPVLRLRVKTLDLTVSAAAAVYVVTLLGAPLWSPDSTRFRFNVFGGKFWFFRVFFSLSLICFVRVSPLHLVSVRPLWLYL
jgi:hypothetical protein